MKFQKLQKNNSSLGTKYLILDYETALFNYAKVPLMFKNGKVLCFTLCKF